MIAWAFLAGAIASEVGGTLSLRMAATGQRAFYAPVAGGYVVAFALLALALENGMPLAIGYAIWTAAGIALTALASRLLFAEALTAVMACGIALIAVGVLIVDMGATY